MRPIKFRAWDNHDHKMIYIGCDLHSYQGWELMQFTGLLDRNGKEIYEGDVVRHHDYSSGACLTMPQYTKDSEIKWNPSIPGYSLPGLGWQIDGKKCEVIGNIYENPELVK